MATLKNTVIDSTGYLQLPVGNTAQRPGNATNGMVRFNSDTSTFEVFNAAATAWNVLSSGPVISQIQITDSNYDVLDDTAVDTAGGYIKITGSNFSAGAVVIIGNVNATSTTVVSNTVLNVQVPAAVAGTYTVYVVNSGGGTAIAVNGLTYSALPTWTTGSSLPSGVSGTPVSIQLAATDATSFALAAGNTLPSGLTLTSGGLLSGTVTVGSETTYSFTVIATDAQAQDSPRAFTITISVGDPYFYLTTLLLPGNGTNNGTNNTFVDGSTNNFTITRNGNTTQGTFTPFSLTGWSNYFDGTGDYLTWNGSALSGDFTVECWVYKTAVDASGYTNVFSGSTGNHQLTIDSNTAGSIGLVIGASVVINPSGTAVTLNAWHHLAWVREGSTCRAYVNGVQQGTGTSSASFTLGKIGQYWEGGYEMNGYVSNARIVAGTCLYPSGTTFTPPTSPLTAVANTSLLTCQNSYFKDNSTNNFTITVNGNTSVQSFSPFAPNAGYTTATIGGSAYFDGTGDLLRAPNNAAFDFGTQNLTFEAWVYPTAYNGVYNGIITQDQNNGQAGSSVSLGMSSSGQAQWFAAPSSGAYAVSITGSVVPLNAWTHLAGVRSGNVWTLYMNGVSIGTATSSVTITQGSAPYGGISVNGLNGYGLYYFPGYISGARVVNGSAVYSSNFTPPTSPPTAIANTALLLNFTNGQITDATSKNILETVGDAKISTAQSKWGGSSMYFDGASDRLTIPYTNNFLDLGVGGEKFTLEAWIYPTNAMVSAGQILSKGGGVASWSTTNGAQYQWTIYNSTASWNFNSSGSSVEVSSGTVTLNAWQHLAVTYDGTTTRTFLNGVLQSTSTSSYTAPTTRNLQYIGMTQSGGYTQEYYGYINDLRITKGYARYTANFTPSTTAFPTQ